MAVSAEPVDLLAGRATLIRVAVKVAEGYHVQANPASAEYLVPTVIALHPAGNLQIGRAKYPPSQTYRLEGTDEDLATYAGSFEILIPVHANPDAGAASLTLSGMLRFQACDARVCLFPDSIPVSVPLRVSPAGP